MALISEYRSLPSVTELVAEFGPDGVPHAVLVSAARAILAEARSEIARGGAVDRRALLDAVEREVREAVEPWPRRVINATGVVLHTNLGRAVLSDAARRAMGEAAAYSDLELDLESGERGRRDVHVERLLVELTGAEAATIVNNCAGALVLGLSALARGREVVVSRGQAVEIGGRFRIPDVLEQSGATLREVGTTNRTYASDYAQACGADTALLLRVHRSNFHMVGFVSEPGIQEIAAVARERGVWLLDDLGSGALVDTADMGLRHEPTVRESVSGGADLTMFSGDKLLGGPQAGLLVGSLELVERVRRHPLARAFRCDKATLAAMHATLLHYARGEQWEQVPTLRMLRRSADDVRAQALRWLDALGQRGAQVLPSTSAVGGGSLPGTELPSFALALDPGQFGTSADELAGRLRRAESPVMARVDRDLVWLDPRTVQPDEEEALLASVRQSQVA